MFFNSLEYLFFLPLVFIIYWVLKSRLQWQNLFLLAMSYVFYGCWDYRFLSLIVISSTVDFLLAQSIHKSEDESRRKLLLIGSLVVNLGFLLYFKYYNFFIDSFIDVSNSLGFQPNISSLNIILPVGISFYTFQTLSYTIDVYRRKMVPSSNWINFFTYVAFFPQLVAGPIERAAKLLPQIEKPRVFSYEKAKDGMRQILWGFFKKVVIADNCASYVDVIFNNYAELGGGILILGAVLFAFQIYCDFSGYSDIAIGTAKLLGIDLMQNFATPYFARNISEFWRRWHISLSTWFRDYVYIPLGGSRVTKVLQMRNIFAIFLISGFWHGANWTYIFWGFIHALCYLPQVFMKTNRKYLDTVAQNTWFPNLREIFAMFQTFLIVTIAWVFFRSKSITDSIQYLENINLNIDFVETLNSFGFSLNELYKLGVFVLVMLVIEWINRVYTHGLERCFKNIIPRYGLYIILCLLIVDNFYGETSFIYFQF